MTEKLFKMLLNSNQSINPSFQTGADVNMPNSLNMYPLHLAAVNGDVKIVKLLIEHNACIDALNKEQATPLHKACQYNRVQVVRFLVDK